MLRCCLCPLPPLTASTCVCCMQKLCCLPCLCFRALLYYILGEGLAVSTSGVAEQEGLAPG